MRPAFGYFLLSVSLLVASVQGYSQSVTPAQIVFPSTPIGFGSSAKFLVSAPGDHSVTVDDVTFLTSTGAIFTTTTSLPTPASNLRPIELRANSSQREFSATIKVDYTVTGSAPTSQIITAFGNGLCTDPIVQRCDPTGPLCTIDRMKVRVVEVLDADVGIRGRVVRTEFNTSHLNATSSYSMPLSTIWKIGGLDQFVKAPICSLPPIQFTRIAGTKQVATFSWDTGGAPPPSESGTVIVSGVPVTFSYSLPAQMHGWAQTFGGDVELHFDSKFGPHIEFSVGGTSWFVSDMDCMDSSALGALLRQPQADYQDTTPSTHMVVVPQ